MQPTDDRNAAAATPSDSAALAKVPVVEPLDGGVAGASARRIADRQAARRTKEKQQQDEVTRSAHPRVGGLLVKARDLLAEPEKPTSWQKGAAGEEAVGRTFAALAE